MSRIWHNGPLYVLHIICVLHSWVSEASYTHMCNTDITKFSCPLRLFLVFCSVGWSPRWTITKNAYSNILKILPLKQWKFSDKKSDIFYISAQNIDCGYSLEPPRRGGSNEYPQSMFLSRNKKNNVYPCKPQFYYIKVGFKGVKII